MRYAIATGSLLGAISGYGAITGWGVLVLYAWLPLLILALLLSLPSFLRHGRTAGLVTAVMIIALASSLFGAGMLARAIHKKSICKSLNSVFIEAGAIRDRTGACPTNIPSLTSIRRLSSVSIAQGSLGEDGISLEGMNCHDAIFT
jgi:hypothetical protein